MSEQTRWEDGSDGKIVRRSPGEVVLCDAAYVNALEAERDDKIRHLEQGAAILLALQDERDRLRAALEEVAKERRLTGGIGPLYVIGANAAYKEMKAIADAALVTHEDEVQG